MVKFSQLAPHQKLQSMGHLTLEQRYTIQVLLKEGLNQSLIAKRLNRDKSVIQKRNQTKL